MTMERYPLPETLRKGRIGPVREPFASEWQHIAERLRVGLIQDLVETGCYRADASDIARSVLAAVTSGWRH